MTDIFFSYKSDDRERVRLVRDEFASLGFDVFWDQQVPAAVDWDTWIRQYLTQAKCAIVFWSSKSVKSDNVRHEAAVAKEQNKLIPVLLEPLTVAQFPIGLYAQQAVNLAGWSGDFESIEWVKLRREVEAKLTPGWVRRRFDELETELLAEHARREGAERRDKILQAQIVKEVQGQEDLRRERDKAVDETSALRKRVLELSSALSESESKAGAEAARRRDAETRTTVLESQLVSLECQLQRDKDETALLQKKLRELSRALSKLESNPSKVAGGVRRKRSLTAIVLRAKANQVVDSLSAARHTVSRRLRLLRERLEDFFERLEMILARIAIAIAFVAAAIFLANGTLPFKKLYSKLFGNNDSAPVAAMNSGHTFSVMKDTEATGAAIALSIAKSLDECNKACAASVECTAFTYNKYTNQCYSYRTANFKSNEAYDSGARNVADGNK
jgi:TIR domain-containing protein/PAN domain-containing protein